MAVAARYLNRELISIFVVVTLVLLGVALGGQFIGYLQDAALGKYAAESLLTILALRLTEFLQQLLPFAFYLALVLTLGRFHAEQEMAVLQGSGIGPSRLLVWLAPAAVVLAALVGFLSLTSTPANNAALERFLNEQRSNREFDAVSPGIFRTFQKGTRVSYAETVSEDRRELGHVFIAERRADQDVTVWSDTGTQYVDADTGSRFLLLRNGTRYEGRIGDGRYRVIQFATMGQRLTVQDPAARRVKVETLPTATLRRDPSARNAAELHWRFALPIMTLVSAVLGLGVARVKPRQGRFARIVPGLALFVAYYLLLVMTQNALRDGSWPLALGMWPVHGLFGVLAWVLLRSAARPVRA